jgi:hypothetical protein
MKTFTLTARINTDSPKAIKLALKRLLPNASISAADKGFLVKTKMRGETAKELNRNLLSSLRRVTRKTVLRAEWKSDGKTERFFDYVSRGTTGIPKTMS